MHSQPIHADLLIAQKLAYEPSGLTLQNFIKEAESAEYAACTFEMNHKHIIFRTGKITPTKIGQFVTLWKRIGKGPIQPFDLSDVVDIFVVNVRKGDHLGQFVFPKRLLQEKDIVSKEGKGGKRAMRIYPPWDITDSNQAKKTQAWQLKYFFEIHPDKSVDTNRIQYLLS